VPDTLTEGAGEVWDRLAPDLIARNVLTPSDVDEFVGFCDAVARRDRPWRSSRNTGSHRSVGVRPQGQAHRTPTRDVAVVSNLESR
jgi:phage terminase small subunit